jgi:hypothetical protein
LDNIKQTAKTLSIESFREYGMTKKEQIQDNTKYLVETKVNIPIDDDLVLYIEAGVSDVEVYFSDNSAEKLMINSQKAWNHPKVQKLFKDVLGLNFNIDPDFKNAYFEIVKSEYNALNDLGKLAGRVLFNTAVNNFYAPKPEGEGALNVIKSFIDK